MPEATFPQPLGGNEMPRFGGPATMMRLPPVDLPVDVGFVGVPLDIGTSNRPGARFGPRAVRAESCLLRPYNMATRAAPFDSLHVGDTGDVAVNTFNLPASIDIITDHYRRLLDHVTIPLSIGGDHTITYPILRAIARAPRTLGLVHVDAHADVNRAMFGEPITHGSLAPPRDRPRVRRPEANGADRAARYRLRRRRLRLDRRTRCAGRTDRAVLAPLARRR